MTDFSSQSLGATWALPIQHAPKEIKMKVASNLNLMRFTGNVVDIYISAMSDVAEGFLSTVSNDMDNFLLEDEAETENDLLD